MMFDYIIIGSGIIGCMIARELSKYNVKTLVLEKENDVVNGQTIANSAIIHAGHDPKPGTLKAKLCVLGNQLYDQLEKELSIPLLRTGGFVASFCEAEDIIIDQLYENALKNGVFKPSILYHDELLKLEPHINPSIRKALYLPSTKVTYPWEVAINALEHAMQNGVELKKNSSVEKITDHQHHFEVQLSSGDTLHAKHIINAAGVFSDDVARLIDRDVPFRILPKKGEYYVLDRHVKGLFNHVIYPVPNIEGKGVLITPQVHGNILLGPTAVIISDKDDLSTTKSGLEKIKKDVKRLSNNIPYHLIIRNFAGIRASSSHEDFYIKASTEHPHFYHIAGIDSPGLTAAPAIASYVIKTLLPKNLPLKKDYKPYQTSTKLFHTLSHHDQQKAISKYPRHGVIICKCEKVTEQDVIHQINRPLGSHTIKGIKKRARAGSGLCQGGYCESLVLKVIAEITHQPLNSINYDQLHTEILQKETKVKP